MKRTKYTAEFKLEAVKQVIDKGHTVVDVAKRMELLKVFCKHEGLASSRKQ